MPGNMMKKKRRVSYKDTLKGYNVILHYYIHILYKISSLWNQLVKFQSIFSQTGFHHSRPSNKIYMLHILCTQRFFFFFFVLV